MTTSKKTKISKTTSSAKTIKKPVKVTKPTKKLAPVKKIKPVKKVSKKVEVSDPSIFLLEALVKGADDAKGNNIVVLDLRDLGGFSEYLIIVDGASSRQVYSLADRMQDSARNALKRRPIGVEGVENSQWILVDYGEVVCHVFSEETRNFYNIEELWHDAKRVNVTKWLGKKMSTASSK